MARAPIVSVLIPFLNAQKFLREAIESVIAQTFQDWELLLIDDGSTDASSDLARQFAREFADRVQYIEHEGHQNRGMSASRNLGLRSAEGKYICSLDSDDVWLPHKLSDQIKLFETHSEVTIVYGASQHWNSWTGNPVTNLGDLVPALGVPMNTVYAPPDLLFLLYPLGNGQVPGHSSLIFRREVPLRIGGYEESFCGIYQMYDDQGFFSKIFLRETVFVSDQVWDKLRLHPDSFTAQAGKSGTFPVVERFFFEWFTQYLIHQGVQDRRIWTALRKATLRYRHPILYRLTPRYLEVKFRQLRDSSLLKKSRHTVQRG